MHWTAHVRCLQPCTLVACAFFPYAQLSLSLASASALYVTKRHKPPETILAAHTYSCVALSLRQCDMVEHLNQWRASTTQQLTRPWHFAKDYRDSTRLRTLRRWIRPTSVVYLEIGRPRNLDHRDSDEPRISKCNFPSNGIPIVLARAAAATQMLPVATF